MRIFIFILVLFFAPISAQAEVQVLGTFDDWTTYLTRENAELVCFVASEPFKDEGRYRHRGKIFLTVSHRPQSKIFDQLTIMSGYIYQKDTDAELKIGSDTYYFFTSENMAFARKEQEDTEIVQNMRKGGRVFIKGISDENETTRDTFSLKGFENALEAMNRVCRK